MSPSGRPRGRRPGHDDTRGTIACAARDLFAERGYNDVSVRAIARRAAVDPALVHHYFNSKAQLFAEVMLDEPCDVEAVAQDIMDGDPDTIGQRAAKHVVAQWDTNGSASRLSGWLEDGPRRHYPEYVAREVFTRVSSRMGHANAVARGQLAMSAALGVMVGRHVLEMGALSTMSGRAVREPLAAILQHALVSEW